MSAVLFLTGETMGDACGSSGRALRTEFEQMGHEYREIDFAKPGGLDSLNRIIKETPIEFVYSFVGFLADLTGTTAEGKEANLWESLGVPFISLYGDSPAYFLDRHVLPGRGFASLYAFTEHYEMRKRLPNVNGLLGVLPPVLVDLVPKSTINFSDKGRGKLLFLKNGNDPNKLLAMWRQNLSETLFLMLLDLAGELSSQIHTDLGNDIDAFICGYLKDKGLDVDAMTNVRLFLVAQLDDYCRRLKSTFIVESLLDFPIEVHGFNWEHVDFTKKRAKLIPTADYNLSRALMKEALGVIDMSPNTGMSPHDRPRRAFGSYTLCLTNEQQFFKRRFPQYESFSFKFEKESLQSKVADVIGHPKRFIDLGIEVSEAYRTGQESDVTGRYMLDSASIIRLERSSRFPNLQNYFGWPPTKTT
jgi:hypothetical protein